MLGGAGRLPCRRRRAPRACGRAGWLTALLAAACPSAGARAQSPAPPPAASTLKLSLPEAIAQAQAASELVEQARAGLDRTRGENYRARSELLPSLVGSASYDRTIASEFEGLFAGVPPAGEPAMPGNSGPSLESLEALPFGQRNTYRFGLSVSQNVYTGGRARARRGLAEASGRLAGSALATARAQAVLDVATAYSDALLAERLLQIADDTLALTRQTLEVTRAGKEAGAQPAFEVLRAQVAVDNQRPIALRRRMNRNLALLRLRQLLDLPADRPLALTSELETDPRPLTAAARQAAGIDAQPGPRAPVLDARSNLDAREASRDLARSQGLPALSIGSQLGRVAYPADLWPAWGEFRTNWTVGAALTWALFSGGRVHGDVLAAEADLREARATLRLTGELAALDDASSRAELDSARAVFEASAGSVEQARQAYQLAELRYREGVSTLLELTDARLAQQIAHGNRAQAARDLLLASIRLTLLPSLPLPGPGLPQGAGGAAAAETQALPAAPAAGATPGATPSPGAGGGAFPP